jgi:hypothetical protein
MLSPQVVILPLPPRHSFAARGRSGAAPAGGRRAGLLAHAYRAQLVGLSTRTFTGWLEVTADGAAVYAPHTSRGFVAPPRKNLLLVSNGLLAKFGIWRAHRRGTAERLEQLAAEKAGSASGGQPASVARHGGADPRQMRG